ncbi:DNA repair protein RecO [Thalassolituus sp. LLYu03]|uniref:DNA repair protein RecO n=1 Tax=Thalassolituus sp. LLYu03 TaxID=3421656 RepID=UPI003D2B1DA6
MAALLVLQRQPLREQEWLLDILTDTAGRLSVVASGRIEPQLLHVYSGFWASADDWPRLRALELTGALQPEGQNLYCALYLTELLTRLVPKGEPLPALFAAFCDTLRGLQGAGLPDPWLRLFEMRLLSALGYGFSWQSDCAGQPIDEDVLYLFKAREGFVRESGRVSAAGQGRLLRGQDIRRFAQGQADVSGFACAKRVLRIAIDDLLDKPLVSRELFQALPEQH